MFVWLSVLVVLVLVFAVPAIRRQLLSRWIMPAVGAALPRMGETERIALEAGSVWWDAELFSGRPDWKRLLAFRPKGLTDAERAFIAGPVETLCGMLSEWDVLQRGDLSPEAWAFLKKHRFFGMIIPEEYGGLGFSAAAHSAVITKIASRSVTASVTAMVPNSLGPAELLLHYGTAAQKRHYLPRLAAGEEIPCFALTEPEAGSDATAQHSVGIVEKGIFEGHEVLGMRLNWSKRYITLAPVATVLGLAFALKDPNRLLGGEETIGITCALLPTNLPGIEVGERHDPLGVPFLNGPTFGTDVFVPLEFIIGGPEMAGKGWRMLMENLAAGRGISLPSLASGCSQLATRVVTAYGTVREQFGLPIGRFEGIEEPIARIVGRTYLMDAARRLTLGAVDEGQKPAVISAIVKHYLTEGMRAVVNDAMDVQAGAGISRGPRNVLAAAYAAVPIGITVEGANILTRSLIIYGQGAVRCHPYVQKEMAAIAKRDLAAFDRAFFAHLGHVLATIGRSFLDGLTGGRFAGVPVSGPARPLFGRLAHLSAAFALTSEVAMATLGGSLKRLERLSGRLADALAWMYLSSATLKRYVDDGQKKPEWPIVRWASAFAFHQAQLALLGVMDNLPNRPAAWFLRAATFPAGARHKAPTDRMSAAAARSVLEDRALRLALTPDLYVPPASEGSLGRLEAAFAKAVAAQPVDRKLKDALRARRLPPLAGAALATAAREAGLITEEERHLWHEADAARRDVIQVDAFPPEAFSKLTL
ncbi:MAG TPA: acyl-CoA dehydrogenase [Candidatus Eisenbacteria bacterium]